MVFWIIRIAIVLAGALIGAVWPPIVGVMGEPSVMMFLGALIGAVLAGVLVLGLTFFERATAGMVFGGLAGFIIAALLAMLINALIFDSLGEMDKLGLAAVRYIIIISFCVAGLALGVRRGRWLTTVNIKTLFSGTGERKRYNILDTSVIIDGRVADICETGFLDGTLVVPQFVLRELQQIADSSQALKRNRGRRGLEILQKIQKMGNVQVIIAEKDFPEIPEVDLKLIEMARTMGGKIVTNDFNLNKVAQLRGVQVLNINELANALKPVVLPGELMRVFILKEGKEANQGIGYLDDGTMIVVDNAKHLIGQTIELVVTSVLQTTAGKMIFGKTEEDGSAPLYVQSQPENDLRKRARR
jgi:uncharacterized protein YacL